MIEDKTIKKYLAVLADLDARDNTFRREASQLLRHELPHPDTIVSELLTQIDRAPGTQFERYLRRRVRVWIASEVSA